MGWVASSDKGSTLGLSAGLGAFLIWGVLVLFWRMLDAVSPFEILCYRIIFSFVAVLPLIFLTHRWAEVFAAFRDRKIMFTMLLSSCVVGLNWFLYIWAISKGRVLETSLGYYINPLMNMLLGILFLKERPSNLQTLAIGFAGAGVAWSVFMQSQFPWLSLMLALSFALYGFIRKTVSVEALPGLFIETIILTPLALGWVLWLFGQGQGFLTQPTLYEGVLLVFSGPVTSLPLVLFAFAARHLRLMTLGILQYLAPTCTFCIGLYIFGEPLNPVTLGTFAFIWVALLLYTFEGWRMMRAVSR